jgi:hypothetical protein
MPDNQNPYDALIQQDTAERARVNVMDAADKNPDTEAKLQGLAKQYGMPVDAVRLRQPEIERKAKIDALDYDSLARRYPTTSGRLADPAFAAIAHDDVNNLSGMEAAFSKIAGAAQYLFSAPQAKNTLMGDIGGGVYGASRGAAGVFQAGAELAATPLDFMERYPSIGGNPFRRLAEGFASSGADAKKMQMDLSPPQQGVVAGGISSGVQSLTQNMLALPMAFLPGGQGAALTMMSSSAGGQTYQQDREAGVGQWTSLGHGVSDSAIEYATEKLPLSKLMGDVKEGTPLIKSLMHNAALEVPGEQLATVMQDLNEWAVLHPEKPFSDYLAERPSAAAQTLIATLIGVGGNVSLTHAMQKVADNASGTARIAQQAEAHSQVLGELSTLAEASKLRERDPAQFSQFMQSLVEDGAQSVYVEAKALMQSSDFHAIAQVLPSVSEQIEQAAASGGDVVIPTAELMTAGPGNTFMQSLLDNARTSPDAMSPIEAREYMQSHGDHLKADIDRVLAERSQDDKWVAMRNEVRDGFKAQLDATKRFTSDANHQYATLLANFYSVTAAKMGITPQELVQRYGLQVTAKEAQGGNRLDQGGAQSVGPFGQVFEQFKGDAQGAIAHLRQVQGGEAIGALHHPELGDIDLVWGEEGSGASDGYGLAKLAKYHPDVLDNLQEIVSGMAVAKRSANRAMLESADHKGGVRLTWDGKKKHWLLTAFKKGGDSSATTDTAGTSVGGDTARPDDASDASVDQVLKTFYQHARGSINLPADLASASAIIGLFNGADLSTFIHESGHFFLEVQMDLASRIQAQIDAGGAVSEGERSIVDDASKILAWFGVKGAEDMSPLTEWSSLDLEAKRPMHEQWARGFEAYAFEGNSPSVELSGMFQKFRAWMIQVYNELKALNVTLTDDVRGVMDRMVASTEAIQEAEAFRRMGPLFKTAEQASMTMDEFKAYHDAATGPTQAAIDDLQSRGLRDMKWLSNARDRKLKELQKQADAARRDVHIQVRSEVMSQPVYRAWQFLTGKADKAEPSQAVMDNRKDLADHAQKRAEAQYASTLAERDKLFAANPEVKGLLKGQLLAKNRRQIDINVQQAMLDWDRSHTAPEKIVDSPQGEQTFGRLSREDVKALGIPAEMVDALNALKMTAKDGTHPDAVAESFGFTSGDELVRSLAAAENPKDVIQKLVDQSMIQQHGDLGTPEGLQRAVDRAIHNEARARFIATEIKALEAGSKVRKPGAGKSTVDVLALAAKDHAQRIIGMTKVRDLRPTQYTNAEARSARAAEKAMLAGDTAGALMEKRHQLINNQAAKAAIAAREEVDAVAKYLGKFDSKGVRSNLPADYVAQIDMLLEKFDLRKQSGAAVDRTVALRTWVQSRLAAGEIPVISEALLTHEERSAYEAAINARDDEGNLVYPDDDERIKLLADSIDRSVKMSFKDMTVDELRGLRDTVKQIEHLARLKDKLLTARDGRGYAATRDALVNEIKANAKSDGKNVRTDNTMAGGWLEGIAQFGASHIKVATWMRIFDGGKDGGAWWSTILRPANERASFETTRRAEATSRLMEILGPVLKDVSHLDKIGKGRFFPELGTSLNWEERFTIACNYGNESNLQRLMGGGIAGVAKSLDMRQVQAVLRSLTAAEWHAVQGVWDHFETYRPEIAAKELRVNGVEPQWIAARPFEIKTADGKTVSLRGGYYPVVFDSKTSLKAQQHSDAQSAKDAMKAAYSAATTQRSFTKARVEEVRGRSLLLNLRGLYSGTNDVIHDLAWHEWVIDVNKLLRSASLDEAVRDHYGANVKKEITKWRDDIVAGSKRLDHGIENAAGWARKFTSSAALTYNVMSAILQPLGITQSFSRVGVAWVGKGIAQYVAGPVEATRMAREKSAFMANRTRTMFRDINELRNRIDGQTTARELMGRYGYFATMHMQMVVDVPTWIGGYEKAMAAGHDEATAIALADQGVKDSQGGGEEVDQAGITRGGPLVKLFTAFYDFMNTQANVLYLANATSKSKANAFMHFAMVGVATPILAAALKAALTPGDSGDWDEKHILRTMIREGIANLFGMVAFGREFTGVVDKMLGTNKGFGYSGPTGLRVIPDTIKLVDQAAQGDMDDAFRKSFLNVIGDVSGIPAAQINRTVTGAQALNEGKTDNPAALVFGYQHP